MSDDQAVASANQVREAMERYLKEMSIPEKYIELIFSGCKAEYEVDFEGVIPELKDWMDERFSVTKATRKNKRIELRVKAHASN
jgi:hypothetical protein